MKYKYDQSIVALKHNLQNIVYELDRSFWIDEAHSKGWHFNQAIKYLDEVIFKVQTFQQDQEMLDDMADRKVIWCAKCKNGEGWCDMCKNGEGMADYNMKMTEAEDEYPF